MTMTRSELLAELARLGVKLWVENDQLCISAKKGVLTGTMRNGLKELKPELLSLLRQQVETQPDMTLPEIEVSPERLHQPFPLTDVQQAYWLGRSGNFSLGDVSAHYYIEVDGKGLNADRLSAAWRILIERH